LRTLRTEQSQKVATLDTEVSGLRMAAESAKVSEKADPKSEKLKYSSTRNEARRRWRERGQRFSLCQRDPPTLRSALEGIAPRW